MQARRRARAVVFVFWVLLPLPPPRPAVRSAGVTLVCDLAAQRVRGTFAVAVYEAHARSRIEGGFLSDLTYRRDDV